MSGSTLRSEHYIVARSFWQVHVLNHGARQHVMRSTDADYFRRPRLRRPTEVIYAGRPYRRHTDSTDSARRPNYARRARRPNYARRRRKSNANRSCRPSPHER